LTFCLSVSTTRYRGGSGVRHRCVCRGAGPQAARVRWCRSRYHGATVVPPSRSAQDLRIWPFERQNVPAIGARSSAQRSS